MLPKKIKKGKRRLSPSLRPSLSPCPRVALSFYFCSALRISPRPSHASLVATNGKCPILFVLNALPPDERPFPSQKIKKGKCCLASDLRLWTFDFRPAADL